MSLLGGRFPFGVLLLACLSALVGALVLEHFFALAPCSLCLYQRYVFFGLGALCALGLFFFKDSFVQKWGLTILLIGFLGLSGLAFYQLLVEQKIVEAPKVCRFQNKAKTIEDFLAQAKKRVVVPCDQPQGYFLGLTMTTYSLLFSLGLCGYTGLSMYARRRENSAPDTPTRRVLP
jgi:disulfide bond formation protein DsbB